MKNEYPIGGIFKTYQEYLSHWMWAEKKEIEFSYRKWCEICGSRRRLELHHLTYERVTNEKSSDFLVVCKKCHHCGIHKRELKK